MSELEVRGSELLIPGVTPGVELIGRQSPTFLWIPPHDDTLGVEVIELALACGLVLDPWQKLLIKLVCSVDPLDSWLCFEVAIVVSRQNGKGAVLQALELAWLFLFGDRLIAHSAHLFETSREHFLKMQALITDRDDFRRRVKRMREGRGSEEIELLGGQRLKFMTRKGGAGRGFTGNKVVFDEAMYLDATMMAAVLPTLATVPNCQVVYVGSAGMKHSTQLGAVRKRALTRADVNLMYAEWTAARAIRDEHGKLVGGDDPADPETWAKANPALGIRITVAYVRREMAALGGPETVEFGTERLGIGDWPVDGEAWDVISKEEWAAAADAGSQIVEGAAIALAIDSDPDRTMGVVAVCGLRDDGRRHVEVIERHRGTGWIVGATTAAVKKRPAPAAPVERADGDDQGDVADPPQLRVWEQALLDRMVEFKGKYRVVVVVVLKTSATASLIGALTRAGLPVQSPSDVDYAQACGDFQEGIADTGTVVHLDQPSVNAAVGGAAKREVAEGGWRWSRSAPAEPAPVVAPTLALWGHTKYGSVPRSRVF